MTQQRIAKRISRRRRRESAGYTVVEVLMSMAVLAVGVVGIIATEKVTLAANQHSKNLAMATHIGEAWLGMLDAEAALWGTDGTFSRTTWLAQGNGVATWFRPNYDATLAFGPAFDALGNPVATANQDPNATFCVDLRLAPLTTTNLGGGMIRAEVRVMWLRDQAILDGSEVAPVHACSLTAEEASDEGANRLVHFVFMSSAVRQVGG